MLRGDLNGKEIQKWGDLCIRVADSLFSLTDSLAHWLTLLTHFDSLSTLYGRNEHNIVKQLYYTPLKKKKPDYIQGTCVGSRVANIG